jgi:hypothetical protein
MKTYRIFDLLALLSAFLPLGYLLLLTNNPIPAVAQSGVPVLTLASLLAAGGVLNWAAFRALPQLDPRKNLRYSAGSLQKIALAVNLFLGMLGVLIIRSIQAGRGEDILGYLPFGAALLLALIGNYLTQLRPNYFAGIRTPWTLSSDAVWRKTHQVAGPLLFWLSLAVLIPMLFVPAMGRMLLLAGVLVVGSLYPVYYSYRLYRQEKQAMV